MHLEDYMTVMDMFSCGFKKVYIDALYVVEINYHFNLHISLGLVWYRSSGLRLEYYSPRE